jgi:RND family efflux transporter MFP subunit
MKKYLFTALGISLVFFGIGILKVKERKKELENLQPPQKLPLVVEISKVKKGELPEYSEYRGLYTPLIKGTLSAKTTGLITELKVREGDFIKKGQIVAIVDPIELRTKLESLKAKLSAIKAKVSAMKLAYETQKEIFKRNEKLFRQGGISKEQYQLSKTKLKETYAQYVAALAELKSVEEELKNLKEQLEKYVYIRAPYDGKVRRIFKREGSFVGAGVPILEIENNQIYRILVRVPSKVAISVNAPAFVITPEGQKIKLAVKKILPVAENNLKVVELYTKELKGVPEDSIITVRLLTKKCKGFIIPSSAVLYLANGTFVVNTQKKLIPIKVEAFTENKACVYSPLLKENEEIITAGQFILRQIALYKWNFTGKNVH